MKAFNAGGESTHIYPPNSISVPGNSFTAQNCSQDLDFNDVLSELQFYTDAGYTTTKSTFNPGETMYGQVKIKNSGGAAITSNFDVGFYLEPGASPICLQVPNVAKTVTAPFGAGSVDTWQFTIPAPVTNGAKIAYAFADYQCTIPETNENNNIKSKAYTVDINGWFETVGGDVGSHGQIQADMVPPNSPAKYNTSYLVVGTNLNSNIKTERWSLNSYSGRLIPVGGTYNYLAERFRQKATNEGSSVCNIPAGLPSGDHFYYCVGDASFHVGNGPNGNNVFFIDGNLNIDGNLTLGAGDTSTFIVQGNISVDANVTRIDGIYIAGANFSSSITQGQQLVVNGAVYADTVSLGRTLASSGCGVVPCDNSVNPSERIIFDPKYLIGLNNLLGSPSFNWREVAP